MSVAQWASVHSGFTCMEMSATFETRILRPVPHPSDLTGSGCSKRGSPHGDQVVTMCLASVGSLPSVFLDQ